MVNWAFKCGWSISVPLISTTSTVEAKFRWYEVAYRLSCTSMRLSNTFMIKWPPIYFSFKCTLLYQSRFLMSLQRIIFLQPLVLIILHCQITNVFKTSLFRSVSSASAQGYISQNIFISFSTNDNQTLLLWMRNYLMLRSNSSIKNE